MYCLELEPAKILMTSAETPAPQNMKTWVRQLIPASYTMLKMIPAFALKAKTLALIQI